MKQHYRTTPPPRHASQAALVAWAVEEGRHYPGQPQFYYTYWLARVKPAGTHTAITASGSGVRALAQMELGW